VSETITSPVPTRARRRRLRAGVATLVVAAVSLAACMNSQQQVAFDLVNGARADAGLPALALDPIAQTKAQAWAEHLAATGSIGHSNLTEGMDGGWRRLAENVGYGSSIDEIQRRFMDSPHHRQNVLDRSFTHLGVGVARGGGNTYVVLVFVQR
jgi:uncharacterized protein YkwD